MTSNIGSMHLLEGIDAQGNLADEVQSLVMNDLRHHFRPEFLNRVDETVLFTPLLRSQIGRIVDLQVAHLQERLQSRKVRMELSEQAKDFIAEAAYDPVYGARPLKRYLQHALETPLARKLIAGEIAEGERVRVEVEDDMLVFVKA